MVPNCVVYVLGNRAAKMVEPGSAHNTSLQCVWIPI
jgi:hypothetical protein